MKLRRFLEVHAEDAMGRGFWGVIDLSKKLADDPALRAKGRGPGSGPDATPYNVTKMLLAALADVPAPEASVAVFKLFTTQLEGNDTGGWVGDNPIPPALAKCGLTGAYDFGAAVRTLLSDSTLAERVERVEVRRGANDASIYWRDGDTLRRSRFVTEYDKRQNDGRDARGLFRTVNIIGGALLAEMARDIAED